MDDFLNAISRHADQQPDALALEEDGLRLTYRELTQVTDSLAHSLSAADAPPGGSVCYLGTSVLRRIVSLVAAVKANRPFIVLNPRDPAKSVADIARHAGAAHLITGSHGLAPSIAAIGLPPLDICNLPLPAGEPFTPAGASAEDTAYILYTSGSTGRPKGVPTSRYIAMEHTLLDEKVGNIHAGDRMAILGQVWNSDALAGLLKGTALYCYDFAGRGGAGIPEWMRQRRITYADAYPAMLRAIMSAADTPIPSMRRFMTNGEPIMKDDIAAFERVFPGAELAACFGSSEYILIALYLHRPGAPFPYAATPLGEPIDPEYFNLLGSDGRPVPPGEPGEVVMQGYQNDPARSASVFPLDPETGWRRYHSGDYAYYDAAGVLHSAGRADDQIKIRGYTLRTSDVEHEILGLPGIRKVAVAGFPGPQGIQHLACHFEAEGAPAPNGEDIRQYLRGRVPNYMVPGHFVRHERLPTTATGKILRRALPNPLDRESRAVQPAATPEEEQLAAIWCTLLGHRDFGMQDDFFDIGGDSLQAMAMLTAIEQQLAKRLPLETLILNGATIRGLCTLMAKHQPAGNPPITRLNKAPDTNPLIALHVIGGHLSDYLEIAHAFAGVRPVLGIGAGGSPQENSTIEAIAAAAASTIRRHVEGLPAALIGFSAGAAFALETARALATQGDAPPPLVLLDGNCAWLDRLRWLRFAWRAVKTGDAVLGGERLAGHLASLTGAQTTPRNLDEAHLRALLNHRPAPLRLPRCLLVTGDEGQVSRAERAEWQRLLGDSLEIATIPGDHMSMIRAPHAGALAQRVESWLRA